MAAPQEALLQAAAPLVVHGDRSWPAPQLRGLPVPVRELLAGGIAGAVGKSSVAPLERCKILFQTGKLQPGRLGATLANIYEAEGPRGLFRGNGASVLRIIPYAALHFGAYEYYRRLLVDVLYSGLQRHDHVVPPVVDLATGAAAGATAVLVTYPLDLVRTRLAFVTEAGGRHPRASATPSISSSSVSSSAAASTPAGAGAGVAGTAAALLQQQQQQQPGGRAASSWGASPSGRRLATPATPAAVGAAAARALHLTPSDPRHTIRGVLLSTLRLEGVRGMYHGVGASFYGILPYAGLKFYVYQHLKQHYHLVLGGRMRAGSEGSKPRLPVPVMLSFGGVAGLVAQTATYPFDVVRRRMQVEGLLLREAGSGSFAAHAAAGERLTSTPQALALIWRQQGWRALYAGLSINYLKVVPSTAIGFTMYDWLKASLDLPTNL